jgi:hypothetical protein
MARAVCVSLFLAAGLPAAATALALTDSDIEYLGILNQRGSQIVAEIVQNEDALGTSPADRRNIASTYCFERLRRDMEVITQDGDHLQSIGEVARKMTNPKDEETLQRLAQITAATTLRKLRSLHGDVGLIADVCPNEPKVNARKDEILSFMDDLAKALESISAKTI